jgi:TetR/AcrR family transcriptional repressor of nem operon
MAHANESKERLLTTAADLLSESSYGAVTVDEICARADVRKGSFYHFFPSKSDLAVAALEDSWERGRAAKDVIFSPQVAPLDRFSGWCDSVRRNVLARKEKAGKVLGCPYTSLGSELSTQDEKVRLKCQEIAERYCRYLESAVRDAQREGLIDTDEPGAKAREIYAYMTGITQQAKINNDVVALDQLRPGVFRLLGVREAVK